MKHPELSVIVTVVDGGLVLERCLEGLARQTNPPPTEVIVPYDETISDVANLAERFPEFQFMALGALAEEPIRDEYSRHVLYDRRRSCGLLAAKGRLLAMLEDRGRPQPNWARSMIELHKTGSYAAVGGPIENGADGLLRWAIFFCDFGRFQAPLEEADPEYVSDINICYARRALEQVQPLWEQRYQEPVVNWALRSQGHRLYLSDRPVVVQHRPPLGLGTAIKERVDWARTFGELRGRDRPAGLCLLWAAATPALPLFLFFRHLRRQLRKGRHVGKFFRASPVMLVLLSFWALGEFLGYCRAGLSAKSPKGR